LELYAAIKQALVLGDTIWQEDYWQDKRAVRVMKKLNFETGKEEFVKKEIFDYDDVYGETVPLFDFFVDPSARTINRGRYKANDAIRRYIMNYDTFMETFKGTVFDQFGASQYVKPGGDLNYWQFYAPPQGMDYENQVEVLFYWGRRPDKLIVVANDVVMRDGPNPFNHKQLPFAKGSDVPRINQFYARGEPTLLESIQDELTTIRRMRLDRQHLDIWKMFLVSNRENLDEDEAIVAPSRFLYVDDPQTSIKPLEYRDVNPSSYREEELLKQDGREVTGIEAPQAASTATEAAIFKEATQRSLRLKIWLLSRELVTDIVRLRVPNIVQFYSAPKVEQIVGENRIQRYRTIRTTDVALLTGRDGSLVERQEKGEHFFEVTPDKITPLYGGFDYRLRGEPTLPVSKPLLQQRTNELVQNPVIMAAIQSGYYDLGKVADILMESHDHDPETFKKESAQQSNVPEGAIDQTKLLELANRENELLMQGQPVPGTAFATRPHLEVHLAFMKSPAFQQTAGTNLGIMENFIRHVRTEDEAIKLREGSAASAQGQMPLAPAGPSGQNQAQPGMPPGTQAGIMGGVAKATRPDMMMGAEGLPTGMM